MPTKQRSCLFCGGPGLSREHIIARWIGRILVGPAMKGVTIRFHHRSLNPHAGIGVREKTAGMPAYYTRSFCRECNGGWMSRLEERARPVLEPMILGQPCELDAAEQGLLSLWVNKTVLAFQSVEDERTLFARPADFDALHRGQAALPYAQVWAGANVHGEAAWYRAHSARLPGEEAEAINGFGAMLTVGYAIFYMLVLFDQDARLRLQDPFELLMLLIRYRRRCG